MTTVKPHTIGARIWWWFAQFGTVALCYSAFWEGHTASMRVLTFLIWLGFVIAVLSTALADEKSKAKIKARGPTGPRWFARVVDLGTVLVFVASGFYATAVAGLIALMCEEALFQKEDTE